MYRRGRHRQETPRPGYAERLRRVRAASARPRPAKKARPPPAEPTPDVEQPPLSPAGAAAFVPESLFDVDAPLSLPEPVPVPVPESSPPGVTEASSSEPPASVVVPPASVVVPPASVVPASAPAAGT